MSNTFSKRDNFWSKLRVQRNITIDELSEKSGCSHSQVSRWFSGETMPDDVEISWLCGIFEVDPKAGKAEFEKMHKEYKKLSPKARGVISNGKSANTGKPKEKQITISEVAGDIHYSGENLNTDATISTTAEIVKPPLSNMKEIFSFAYELLDNWFDVMCLLKACEHHGLDPTKEHFWRNVLSLCRQNFESTEDYHKLLFSLDCLGLVEY